MSVIPRGYIHAGKLLTAEQSVRFAIVDSVDRQMLIDDIVRRLQATAIRTQGLPDGDAPAQLWRRMEI